MRLLITRVCGLFGRVSVGELRLRRSSGRSGRATSAVMVGFERIVRLAVATVAVVVAAAIKPPLNVPAWDWDPPYIEFCLKVSECEASAVMQLVHLPVGGTKKETHNFVSSCGPKARVCS